MNISIITDAWHPQINGVVHTLNKTKDLLEKRGHKVKIISPNLFKTIPCPTYPEIRLALLPSRKIKKLLDNYKLFFNVYFDPCDIIDNKMLFHRFSDLAKYQKTIEQFKFQL